MTQTKGSDAEREVSDRLEDDLGYAAQRTGASGGATGRPRPDVIAGRHGEAYAIEVKAWADATGSLKRAEIEQLLDYATRFGATPVVLVRPDLRSFDRWHCYHLTDLHETAGGNWSVRQAEVPGRSFEEVFDGE